MSFLEDSEHIWSEIVLFIHYMIFHSTLLYKLLMFDARTQGVFVSSLGGNPVQVFIINLLCFGIRNGTKRKNNRMKYTHFSIDNWLSAASLQISEPCLILYIERYLCITYTSIGEWESWENICLYISRKRVTYLWSNRDTKNEMPIGIWLQFHYCWSYRKI